MNLDDPSEVVPEDATRKKKKPPVYCEWCGALLGHGTKRSKKCTAVKDAAPKKFQKKNGSLLTDSDPDPPSEEQALPAADATGLEQDEEIMRAAQLENEAMESMHWNNHYFDEDDAPSPTMP
jgi:hypothetical protein